MDIVVLIGRILFVLLFLSSGVNHLAQMKGMAGYAQSRGVPLASVAVPASGVLLLIAGLMILLGVWADLGALLLIVFLVPAALLMHAFWQETDAQSRQGEMIHFFKDISLAGASLMLFAFFVAVDDLGLTVTGPLIQHG